MTYSWIPLPPGEAVGGATVCRAMSFLHIGAPGRHAAKHQTSQERQVAYPTYQRPVRRGAPRSYAPIRGRHQQHPAPVADRCPAREVVVAISLELVEDALVS